MPRHARRYRDFAAEHARLQAERVAESGEFRADVAAGAFPAAAGTVTMHPGEWAAFEVALVG